MPPVRADPTWWIIAYPLSTSAANPIATPGALPYPKELTARSQRPLESGLACEVSPYVRFEENLLETMCVSPLTFLRGKAVLLS